MVNIMVNDCKRINNLSLRARKNYWVFDRKKSASSDRFLINIFHTSFFVYHVKKRENRE